MGNADSGHRTVSRVVNILEYVAAAPHGARLNEIAESMDAPKSSIHSLVKGLLNEGYLSLRGNTYRIGISVDRIAPLSKRTLIELSEASMGRLHSAYNETVVLSTLVGGTLTYMATRESAHPIRFVPPRTRPQLPRPSASLKVFLAHFTEREAMLYLSSTLGQDEARGLIREFADIRRHGMAFNRGETYEGMSAAAAGVHTMDGIVACLSIGGVSERMSPKLDEIGQAILREARDISHAYNTLTRDV